MMKLVKFWIYLLLAMLLAACGGGGGNPGSSPLSPPDDPTAVATKKVADIAIFPSKTTILNGGTDTVQVSVVAVDAARNVVAGAKVAVSVDNNSIFNPDSGTSVTDGTGSFKGKVSIGGDKSDRTISLTATVNGLTRTIPIQVQGSRLTLQLSPTSPSPGESVALTASLVDAAGNPIAGATVTVGGDTPGLSGKTLQTGLDGRASFVFAAPPTPGAYLVLAAGAGVASSNTQLLVFNTAVPPVTIPAGVVPSLLANPNVISVNSPNTSSNRSIIRFLILDGQNRPIQGVRVQFSDVTLGVPTVGSSLVNAGKTLYTDASGVVTTDYIAGQNPSPTNGVQIKACYSGTDFTADNPCPKSVKTSLVVAGQALAVSIGDDNVLSKGDGTYIKKFAVTVADAAGKPVVNAPVDISVDLTDYGKAAGPVNTALTFPFVPTSLTASARFAAGSTPDTTTIVGTTTVIIPGEPGTPFVWCPNEDTNRNGFADPGENVNGSVDSNGQATLEPRKSDLLISYADPAQTVTDANGILQIKVEYSQRFATWLAYRIRALANVQGSQGMAERLFVTNFVEGDGVNGSFNFPPYGSNTTSTACSTAN